MKTSAALLGALAVSSVTGSPITSKRQEEDERWPPKEKYCKWDLSTPEAIEQRWDELLISATHDSYLRSHSIGASLDGADKLLDNGWLAAWELEITGGDGRSGVSGCGTIGSTCDPAPGLTCYEFSDRAEAEGRKNSFVRDAYWVFQAVKGMHGKFGELSRLMTKDAVITGFSIPDMVTAFGGSNEGTAEALKWVAAAVGMGGTAVAMVPGVGGPLSAGAGIIGAIIGAAAEDAAGPVEASDMQTNLVDAFVVASNALEDTIRIVTGNAKTDEEYNTLPAPRWDTLMSKVGKFFNGGWWLLDDDSQAAQDLFASIKGNLQRKVANDIMRGSDYYLIVDRREQVNDEGKCRTQRGRHWMEFKDGQYHCFYIAKRTVEESRYNLYEAVEEANVEFYENMAKYGFAHEEEYYKAVLDCALNGGEDKNFDASKVSFGQIPACYFNLEVRFGDTSGTCKSGLAWACDRVQISEL